MKVGEEGVGDEICCVGEESCTDWGGGGAIAPVYDVDATRRKD